MIAASFAIRQATPDDLDWLLGELAAFDRFVGATKSLMPDPETARETLSQMIVGQPFFVAERDGERAGFIAGVLHPHPFNPGLTMLTETFWWVVPAYRGGSTGARLLHAFEAFGQQFADWIVMSLEAESPVAPSSLTRRGYRPQETSYLLEVA